MLYEIEVIESNPGDQDAYYGSWIVNGAEPFDNGQYDAVPLGILLYGLRRASEVGMHDRPAYITFSGFTPGTVATTGETTTPVTLRLGVTGWDDREEYGIALENVQDSLRAGKTHD